MAVSVQRLIERPERGGLRREHGRRCDGEQRVLAALSDKDLLNLEMHVSTGTPDATPDPNKAIMAGLTAAQVAQEVRSALRQQPQRAS